MDSGFYFDLKTAKIFQAVKWSNHLFFKWARPLKTVFFFLFIVSFLAFIYGLFGNALSQKIQSQFFGLSIIFLTLTIICRLKISFLDSRLKNPKLKSRSIEEALTNPEKHNLAEFLSFEVAAAVWKAIRFAQKRKLPKISSESLLYFSLEGWTEANFIFSRALLNLKEIRKELKTYLDSLKDEGFQEVLSPDFQKVILRAAETAQKNGRQRIKIDDILISQCQIDPILKKHLITADLKGGDFENLAWWVEDLKQKIEERKKFWQWKNLVKKGSLAKEWTSGFTPLLDTFSVNLSEIVKKQGFPEVIGHQKEISEMERILARREINNVLLVGEKGSGRKSMIQSIAIKSFLGESLPEVNFKRVLQLDLSSLIAKLETQEAVENVLDAIFREIIAAGNTILVIDDFHNFVGPGIRAGAIDISGIISPYLASPKLPIVAITTFLGLHKYIEQNPSILSLFEKVEVSEISERETLLLLEDFSLFLEHKYKRFISYPAIRDVIIFSARYMPALSFPEKAMELLEETVIHVSQSKDRAVTQKHVAKIVSEKTKIPVGEVEAKEREILLNLENLIHERIINQEEAVKEVSTSLRRARAQVSVKKGPMGGFLFLGPTGVGKTETAKALAEIYFGSEERMVRLDMSEFQSVSDISRLIGSSGETGLLTTQIKENPFSLLLLDEIEKAHPNILNLFLQVLDEGHLTDGMGRKIDFKNSIIIATSNAGYQVILEAIKQNTEWSQVKEKLLDFLFERSIFRPEFINRFDGVVIFKPLSKENLLSITELLLQKLKKNLLGKDIEFIITPGLKEKIVEIGYNPTFGAREMKRVIQDKVENVLAKALLSGELKRGNKVEIDPEDFELKINP